MEQNLPHTVVMIDPLSGYLRPLFNSAGAAMAHVMITGHAVQLTPAETHVIKSALQHEIGPMLKEIRAHHAAADAVARHLVIR